MNKKLTTPSEWPIFEWDYFTTDWQGAFWWIPLLVGVCFIALLFLGGFPAFAWCCLVALSAMVVWVFPLLGRVHKLHGIPAGPSYDRTRLYRRAQEYLSLSEQDRKEYPANILELMKNPDLSVAQSKQLSESMNDIYNTIKSREHQRALARAKNIDIESALEEMERARAGIQIESDTIKELA